MREKTLRDLKYLKQNYKPSEIQKLLNSSKLKREVYQELEVSDYVLNNYIKHYKLSNIHKNGQRSAKTKETRILKELRDPYD